MRERDDVTAERNEDVKEVYWYSAEIVFSNLGFHLGFFFFFFTAWNSSLLNSSSMFFFFFFKSDIRFMLVGAGAGKLIFLAGTRVSQTRVPKTVQLTN